MLKTNRTLVSLDVRGNGILDQSRRQKVVATDGFGRAVIKATIYNPRPTILHVFGANLGRVAQSCGLPKSEFDTNTANEKVLQFAHSMEL